MEKMLKNAQQTGIVISSSWLEEIDIFISFLKKWKVSHVLNDIDMADF